MNSFPFQRIELATEHLTKEEALEHYERYGLLWIKLLPNHDNTTRRSDSILKILRYIYSQDPKAFQRKWSVENAGSHKEQDLSPDAILQQDDVKKSSSCNKNHFYCSTILSRKQDPDILEKVLQKSLKPYFQEGATTPPLLGDSKHPGGAWLFVGKHVEDDADQSNNQDSENGIRRAKKQKTTNNPKTSKPLVGRAEHVDNVTHNGTWHVQLAGRKTWYLRPDTKAEYWQDTAEAEAEDNDHTSSRGPPNLKHYLNTRNTTTHQDHVKIEQSPKDGLVHLCCHVQEGDLFVVNTRAWYHRTEIPVGSSWSISVARDFFLPVPPILCPRDVRTGDVIFEEEDIPDSFPHVNDEELKPNCAMAEVNVDDDKDNNDNNGDSGSEEEGTIVLVALSDLKKGDALVLKVEAEGEDEDDSDMEEENAPESVDPRAIAKHDYKKGNIILSREDIPEELPRSLDPNCELVMEGDDEDDLFVIRSLRSIGKGEVLAVAPDEDDMDEYEEVEVELGTGEMKR